MRLRCRRGQGEVGHSRAGISEMYTYAGRLTPRKACTGTSQQTFCWKKTARLLIVRAFRFSRLQPASNSHVKKETREQAAWPIMLAPQSKPPALLPSARTRPPPVVCYIDLGCDAREQEMDIPSLCERPQHRSCRIGSQARFIHCPTFTCIVAHVQTTLQAFVLLHRDRPTWGKG